MGRAIPVILSLGKEHKSAVVFVSVIRRLRVALKDEEKCCLAGFENGEFRTNNPSFIKQLQESDNFGTKRLAILSNPDAEVKKRHDCPICGIRCVNAGMLSIHMKAKHPEKGA